MRMLSPFNLFFNPWKAPAIENEPPLRLITRLPLESPLPTPPTPAPKLLLLKTQIRVLIRRDMPEVLAIENESFEFAWSEENFLCCLRQRNCIGMVAEYNHRVVGFMIYELHKNELHVLNFAVDPEFRRQTVGAQMVEKFVNKLQQQRRNHIVVKVRETNLAAQLFFKSQKFRARLVLHNQYDDTAEDAYVMQYTLGEEDAIFFPSGIEIAHTENGAFVPVNRITQYDAA